MKNLLKKTTDKIINFYKPQIKDDLFQEAEKVFKQYLKKSKYEEYLKFSESIFYNYQLKSEYNVEKHVYLMIHYGLTKHKNDLNFNKDAYIIACFFHDIGRLIFCDINEPRDKHKEKSLEIFKKEFGFAIPEKMKDVIESCILEHSGERITNKNYAELLTIREADRISLMQINSKDASFGIKTDDYDPFYWFNFHYKDFMKNLNPSKYALNIVQKLKKKINN
ncbi:MAG: HD domain-containing protein [Candidatus Nanoarchaeia archaeon]|nr:HD domain-containing protein [Candidatus Nanoarchaeia archaeon]